MGKSLTRREERGISFLSGGTGDPFLLLHGIPGSASTWETVGRLLTPHYRVVIPDLAGFGRSGPPEEDYYMEAQAEAVKGVLDRLGISELYVGGHDFGGPVGLTLMRLYPSVRIKGLVLSATNVFTDTHVPPPLRVARVPLVGTLFFKAMVGNKLGLRVLYAAATVQKKEAPWVKFERHLTPRALDLTRRIFQRSLADLEHNYRPIEDLLPRLSTPTLVLWGAEDPFFGAPVGERLHRAIRDSALRVYGGTGHFVPEERPRLVARDIMDFFSGRTGFLPGTQRP